MISGIKIYVADLSAYNNSILHGVWIEDLLDIDALEQQVADMLEQSPLENAEEYAIHDYEGFGGLSLSEFISLRRINKIALFLKEHSELGDTLLNYCNGELDEANRLLDECYLGTYDSVEDYAQAFGEECFVIDDALQHYIDWKSFSRDMILSGDIHVLEKQNKVLIFSA